MTEARVIKDYESAYPDPLVLEEGEEVRVEERPSEWDGWLWAIDHAGKGGWIPESYLDRSEKTATLSRDYDATELSVSEGEILIVIDTEAGWCLCQNSSQERGWVPKENLVIES